MEKFAAREPDLRLQELIADCTAPERVRVLDLGCAAGRSTVFLAERGFDIWALDSSGAMVERTRLRLSRVLGEQEGKRRVIQGSMGRHDWPKESFDLVVALGVYHCAESAQEWNQALSESSRVLRRGGRALVSVFTPETDLTGEGLHPVEGEPHVYDGFPDGRSFLVDAPTLDSEMARHGLFPLLPTQTVRREAPDGRRVSANGTYGKR